MLEHTLNAINDFFWSIPFIAFVIFVGAYFTIGSKFFTLVHFGHIIKHTFMSMFRKDAHESHLAMYHLLKPFVFLLVVMSEWALLAALRQRWLPVGQVLFFGCGYGLSLE